MRFLPLIAAAALLTSTIAQACRCRQPPPPKQARDAAAAVFSGKVTKVETTEKFHLKVTFEIARTWKGTTGKRVSLSTNSSSASCGYNFEKGKSYLVYCDAPEKGAKKPVPLRASLCSRTKSLETAQEDLKELGEGKRPSGDKAGV